MYLKFAQVFLSLFAFLLASLFVYLPDWSGKFNFLLSQYNERKDFLNALDHTPQIPYKYKSIAVLFGFETSLLISFKF